MSYDSQTSTSLINKLRKDVDSLTLKIAVLQDVKNNNVAGGTAVTAVWTARTLNTISSDPNSLIIDLASNEWKVAAGNYQVKVLAPFHHTQGTRLRIYDVTNSVVIGYGPSLYINNGVDMEVSLNLRITPHKDTVYRLEYYVERGGHADGLGIASNIGQPEIYTTLEITRLDTGMTKPQGGAGVQGPQGPAGPAGPAGPPGPAGSGTVTSVSVVTANGVSGSVADPTTTPAITLSLGAITPTSVAASGAISAGATVTGSNLLGVNTGDQVIILGGDRLLAENGDFIITESSDYILETGDVTGQGEGRITTTIAPQAVTYDKMQFVSATDRILGRQSAGAGQIEEITCTAAGRAILDDTSAANQRTTLGAAASGAITASGLTVSASNRLLGRVANSAGAVDEITLGAGISVSSGSLTLGNIEPTSVAASGTIAGSNISGTTSGNNTGDQTITLTGDVTGSGTGSFAATIGPNKVTYSKIQDASGNAKLLGSNSSGPTIQEISLGSNLSMTGNTLSSTNPGGTVTSVNVSGGETGLNTSGGPITGSGTITLAGTLEVTNGGTGATSAANALTSLGAYPASNPNGYTSNAGTVTNVSASGSANIIVATGSTTPVISQYVATSSQNGYMTSTYATKLDGITAGASVSSVSVSGGTTGLTTSGGPITDSGTITLGGTLDIANGGTGATTAANALTALGAYPSANPNGYTSNVGTVTSVGGTGTVNGISLSGTVTSSGSLTLGGTLSNVSLSSQVTDTLPIANGGTGLTSVGSQYQVLTSTGSAASWGTVDLNNGTSNTLPIAKGGTGSTSAGDALTALGAYPASNPNGYTSNVGTVTSVSASGGTTGLSFTGTPITGSGTLTLAGTLDIDNGGTGATTASAAITNLAGSATSGQFLRGNGTVVEMSSIQAADVPAIALNTAAVSGILKPLNGGTGQSNVYTDGDLLIGKTSGSTLARAKLTAGTNITITNGSGTITIAATGTGTGDVVGPSSATSGNFVLFDGSTGKLIKGASWNQVNGDIKGPGGYSSMPDGFIYIPASTANPSSTPTNVTGSNVPLYYNTNSNTLWIHNGTSWKSVALT